MKVTGLWFEHNYLDPFCVRAQGSRKLCSNYRPVTLTSQIVKLIERLVQDQLLTHVQVNNIISCNQHALESPYHLVAVSGAHFTQGTILIVILVSSGSAKSRTHQSAVGGFLVTRRGWPGRLRACRIWTFINSV